MKKTIKKILNFIGKSVYIIIASLVTVYSGCAYMTPTIKPPFAEEIGYSIPNYKGITLTGINESVYKTEVAKLRFLRTSIDMVNEPALQAREQTINWLNMGLAAGAFGGIPLAARMIPKNAIKKEDHERIVKEAKEKVV